jgi:V/A-type H+/Na+-transporting ATPase subunit I
MFKPVTMARANIVVLERDEREVLHCLGRLGVLHLVRAPAGREVGPLSALDGSRELARCERLAARVQELHHALEIKPVAAGTPAATITLPQAEEEISAMEKTTGEIVAGREHLAGQAARLSAEAGQLADFCGLGIPLSRPDESAYLHFVTGTIPPDNFQKLQSEVGGNVALLPLPGQKGRQPVIVMTTRQGRPALETLLRQAGFQPATLPVVEGATVDTLAQDHSLEQEKIAAELERLDARRAKLADQFARPLAAIELAVETERRLLEAGQYFSRTESAVGLTGWIPRVESADLAARLREITRGCCVVEIVDPESSCTEAVPVLLRHPRWLRPFAMLVTAYGLPQYHELEPTVFVALSYLLMFGMMFGDAGHGAVLALGGLALRWFSRTTQTRAVGLLLMFGGCASMIFGAVYGSYFGIPALKQFALWHDPLEGNPLNLMTAAIVIGIGMIFLGLVLNTLNLFRRGDIIGALLDKFGGAGIAFYWGALFLFVKFSTIRSWGALPLFVLLFLVLPVVGWIMKEPVKHFWHRRAGHPVETGEGFFSSALESVVGTMEALLSYFANTISFVRLGAYAMSHAALLLAAFMIAADLRQVSPGGTLLGVLVIILGNLVALVLEGIVASVQALRLEYYEFFGKFFSGGGQPFEPFRLQTTTVAQAPL